MHSVKTICKKRFGIEEHFSDKKFLNVFLKTVFFNSRSSVQTADLYSGSSVFYYFSQPFLITFHTKNQQPRTEKKSQELSRLQGFHRVPGAGENATDLHLCRETPVPGSLPLNRHSRVRSAGINMAILP